MNVTFLGIMNGIALAAANAKDTNTVSLMQQIVQEMSAIGTTYDAATTSGTAFLNPTIAPYNGQLFDANAKVCALLGISGKALGA
jgi:hypothetical protein